MRDAKRIPRIISKLQKIWEMAPDQRLCQLLINIGLAQDSARWNIEDEDIEKLMDNVVK